VRGKESKIKRGRKKGEINLKVHFMGVQVGTSQIPLFGNRKAA